MALAHFRCYLCDKVVSRDGASELVCAGCWRTRRLTSDALEHKAVSMHPDKGEEILLVDDDLEKTDPKPFDPWWLRTLP